MSLVAYPRHSSSAYSSGADDGAIMRRAAAASIRSSSSTRTPTSTSNASYTLARQGSAIPSSVHPASQHARIAPLVTRPTAATATLSAAGGRSREMDGGGSLRGSQARSSSTHSRPSSGVAALGASSAATAAKRSASPAPVARRSSDAYGTPSASFAPLRRPSVTGGGVGGPAAAVTASASSMRAALANTAVPSQMGARTSGMSAVRAAGTGPAQPVRAYAPVPAASAQNGTATSAQSALAALNAAHRRASADSHARAPSVERSAYAPSGSSTLVSNDRPAPLSRNGSTNSLLHDAERMRAQQTAAAPAHWTASDQPRAAAPAQPYAYSSAPYTSSSAAAARPAPASSFPAAGYSSPQRHDSPYSSHSNSPYSPAQPRSAVPAAAAAPSGSSASTSASASLYPFSTAYAAANAAHSRAASITNHLVPSSAAPSAATSHSSTNGYSPVAPPRGLSQLASNYSAGHSSAALTGGLSTPASRGYVSRAGAGYDSSRDDDLDRALSDDEDDELERRMAHSRQVSHSRATATGDTVPAAATPARGSNGLPSSGSANGGGGSGGRMRSLVGLGNLGNTCFLNSTLQCLLSTPYLLPYFTRGLYSRDINPKGSRSRGEIAKAFGALAQRMERAADHAVDRPSAVKSAVSLVDSKFAGYGQHDSHEFGRVLLSALHDELNRVVIKPAYVEIVDHPGDSDATMADRWWSNYTERNNSIVTECFAGQLQSSLVCLTCKKASEAFDPFMDLSLPIPKAKGGGGGGGGGGMSSAFSRMSMFSGSSGGSSSNAVSRCTLMDCFSEFVGEEVLRGNEQVYCRNCKTHRDQSKRLRVYRWPRILLLHLKRFSYGHSAYSRSKINSDVDFPLEMDCRALQTNAAVTGQPPAIYDLYGVSNHSGTASGGHYTASAKVSDDPSAPFFLFNDSSVHAVARDAIKGPAAYLLFYRRRGA